MTARYRRLSLALLAVLLLLVRAASMMAERRLPDDADVVKIKKFLESAGDAVNEGDVEAEVARFTEDGIYMWPDAPSVQGHEALREWFEERFARVEVRLESESEELEVFGDWAFERGVYVATIRPKGAENTSTVRGKYLNILRKLADGSWRIARRMRNRDHPPMR